MRLQIWEEDAFPKKIDLQKDAFLSWSSEDWGEKTKDMRLLFRFFVSYLRKSPIEAQNSGFYYPWIIEWCTVFRDQVGTKSGTKSTKNIFYILQDRYGPNVLAFSFEYQKFRLKLDSTLGWLLIRHLTVMGLAIWRWVAKSGTLNKQWH